ncbi:hypothetical protein SAMN04488071_0826 [Kordiimonas lacus]|uniref:Uncharacterized protein n=1 Tax=Kordiimonas lacus TaxID=637679 RepID=A0A1G6VR67_9PROT|nr:hypothetical protein SAMN04488071_0826 [Kordiimonas lacus]
MPSILSSHDHEFKIPTSVNWGNISLIIKAEARQKGIMLASECLGDGLCHGPTRFIMSHIEMQRCHRNPFFPH